MAAKLTERNEYDIAEFTIDSPDDLELLPTQTKKGAGNLSTMSPIAMGSKVFCISDGTFYILNGAGNWIVFHKNTGGNMGGDTGGDMENIDYTTTTDIDKMF